jgi:hypothetical protein
MEELKDAIILPTGPQPFTPQGNFFSKSRILSRFEQLIAECCGGLLEVITTL